MPKYEIKQVDKKYIGSDDCGGYIMAFEQKEEIKKLLSEGFDIICKNESHWLLRRKIEIPYWAF